LERPLNLLVQWREARPFLYIGSCPYSQALVWEMIRQVETVLSASSNLEVRKDGQRMLGYLYKALDQNPPPHSPPSIKTAPRGCFIFFNLICVVK